MGAIGHDRREAAVQSSTYVIEGRAVVEMHGHGNRGRPCRIQTESDKRASAVPQRRGMDLQYCRTALGLGGGDDSADSLQIVDIEGPNSVAAVASRTEKRRRRGDHYSPCLRANTISLSDSGPPTFPGNTM